MSSVSSSTCETETDVPHLYPNTVIASSKITEMMAAANSVHQDRCFVVRCFQSYAEMPGAVWHSEHRALEHSVRELVDRLSGKKRRE